MANQNNKTIYWTGVVILLVLAAWLLFFRGEEQAVAPEINDQQETEMAGEDETNTEDTENMTEQMEEKQTGTNEDTEDEGTSTTTDDTMMEDEDQENTEEQTSVDTGTTWSGTLQESDDDSKGNLMLVLENDSTVYINTSRDYSDLIGEEVVVEYDGSLESFTLVDITAKN